MASDGRPTGPAAEARRLPRARLRWESLRTRIGLLVGVGLLVAAALVIVALVGARQATAAQETADRLTTARIALERLQQSYLDQETGLRGFLLTGQQPFLDPYAKAGPAVVDEVERLRQALGPTQARIEPVLAAHQDWIDNAATPMIELRRAGLAEQAIQLSAQGVGKVRFDRLRAQLDTLRATLLAEDSRAADSAAAAQRAITTAFVVGGIGAIVAAVLALITLRRWVTTPLNRMVTDVTAVAFAGSDDPVGTDGPTELATVGRAVNTMRTQLAEYSRRVVARERRLAEAEQADRIARDLADDVLLELSSITMTLTSLANQHPPLAPAVLDVVSRVDHTISGARTAIFQIPEPAPEDDATPPGSSAGTNGVRDDGDRR